MAINKSNILLNGISGTIGGQITFSQRNGKTIISRKRRASQRPPTEKPIVCRLLRNRLTPNMLMKSLSHRPLQLPQ